MNAHLKRDVAALKRAYAGLEGAIGTTRLRAAQKALVAETGAPCSAAPVAVQPVPVAVQPVPVVAKPATTAQPAMAPPAPEGKSDLSASERETMAFLQRAGVTCHAPAAVTGVPAVGASEPSPEGASNGGASEEETMALLTRAGFAAKVQGHAEAAPVAKWHR